MNPLLPSCLYCGGSVYRPLFDGVRDRFGHVPGTWAFSRCQGCGSATLSPFPPPAELLSFYPPIYSFTTEMGRGPLRRLLIGLEYRLFFQLQYQGQVRRILRRLRWKDGHGRSLLDLGCGRGLRLLAFQQRGFAVQGVDFQSEVVADVQTRLHLPAACARAEDLPHCFPPATFDLVTAFCVLEHLPDVGAALRSCFSVLKPGGWFVGTVPLIDSVQARLFGSRWNEVTEAPRHVSLPSQKGLQIAFQRAGFEHVAIRPDWLLNCSVLVGISLFPGGLAPYLYGRGRWQALVLRALAATCCLLAIPWCAVENHVLRRPSLGLVFAQKPKTSVQSGDAVPGGIP